MMRSISVLLAFGPLAGCLWISASDHAQRTDYDRDGIPADQDCDDHDSSVGPGKSEVPCNNKDDDCNPVTKDGPAFSGTTTFDSVQSALDAVPPGSEITICPGRFPTPLVVRQTGVTLSGNQSGTPTIIDVTGIDATSAITILGGDVTLRNLVITGGTGNDHDGVSMGGGIDAYAATGNVVLDHVEVYACSASTGGGLMAPSSASVGLQLELHQSSVHENTAVGYGGGIAASGSTVVTLTDTSVDHNAAANGGGLSIDAPASAIGQGQTEVADNTAQIGAGIYATGGLLTLVVRENTATDQGGGVYSFGSILTDLTIDGNTAARGGGVAGYGSILRGSITANTAKGPLGGGGVYADQNEFELTGVTIERNEATAGDGGGLLAVGPVDVTVGDDPTGTLLLSKFDTNTAAGRGGGIAANGAGLTMIDGLLQNNTASQGGGIALWGGCGTQAPCEHTLSSFIIKGNHAQDGAGWYTEVDANATALGVYSNVADNLGGGVYVVAGQINDSNSSYDGNKARTGGGIAWSGTGQLSQVTVNNNEATLDGSGLWMINGALDCVAGFQGNCTDPPEGATVNGVGGTLHLNGCSFVGNTACKQSDCADNATVCGPDLYVCGHDCNAINPAPLYQGDCDFGSSADCAPMDEFCTQGTISCP